MDKLICNVCGGKGGWKLPVSHYLDNNWNDCLYCEGNGYVEAEKHGFVESSALLAYNGYKKIITDIIENCGQLISYSTTDQGKIIEISIVAKNKPAFSEFIKALLRFGHYNSKLKVLVNQVFFFDPPDDLFRYHWKIILKPTEITDLDGFVDLIRQWEQNIGRSSR